MNEKSEKSSYIQVRANVVWVLGLFLLVSGVYVLIAQPGKGNQAQVRYNLNQIEQRLDASPTTNEPRAASQRLSSADVVANSFPDSRSSGKDNDTLWTEFQALDAKLSELASASQRLRELVSINDRAADLQLTEVRPVILQLVEHVEFLKREFLQTAGPDSSPTLRLSEMRRSGQSNFDDSELQEIRRSIAEIQALTSSAGSPWTVPSIIGAISGLVMMMLSWKRELRERIVKPEPPSRIITRTTNIE